MRSSAFQELNIVNPKRRADVGSLDGRLFPYYAGYSASFARELLTTASLSSKSTILDPWNGAGTTVEAAQRLGLNAIGIDLNPVMVMVSKASLLSPREEPSLFPLAQAIVEEVENGARERVENEPLSKWLCAENAESIRNIEIEINRTLVSHESYLSLTMPAALSRISPLAAFFYVALFRATRRLLQDFIPSNPTWVKTPTLQARKRPNWKVIKEAFLREVHSLSGALTKCDVVFAHEDAAATISLGSSEQIALPNRTVDLILTSPPYCTRIDYAMATAFELAILRIGYESFDALRRTLMGTSTVTGEVGRMSPNWGATCSTFLRKLSAHHSKASKTYYLKNHVQYFDSLNRSLQELSRVLKVGGGCVLVVQDSHYKELHNDVPTIAAEMASQSRLVLRRREDFRINQSMVRMNKRATKYLSSRVNFESVLCFHKH